MKISFLISALLMNMILVIQGDVYIGNLSFQAEQEDLLDLFSKYGEVKSASLPLDRETGRKRGFAFVEMATDEDEQKAIDDLQNVEWMGRMIRVNKATPRD